jgi:hypothetical protein
MNFELSLEGEQSDSMVKLAPKIMSIYGKSDYGEADLT